MPAPIPTFTIFSFSLNAVSLKFLPINTRALAKSDYFPVTLKGYVETGLLIAEQCLYAPRLMHPLQHLKCIALYHFEWVAKLLERFLHVGERLAYELPVTSSVMWVLN